MHESSEDWSIRGKCSGYIRLQLANPDDDGFDTIEDETYKKYIAVAPSGSFMKYDSKTRTVTTTHFSRFSEPVIVIGRIHCWPKKLAKQDDFYGGCRLSIKQAIAPGKDLK